MRKRGSIGIDIGGTKTLFALFDQDLQVVEEVKIKTQADKGEETFTEALKSAVDTLTKKAEKEKLSVASVGVGCAGTVDAAGERFKATPNIPFMKDYEIAARLAKLTGAPVSLLNDVHAGLYGEHQLGAATGHQHVIGVFLGTGIGGALIVDGQLVGGARGHAGNIGHYLIEPFGPLAGSNRHGVLDDVLGRTAIAGAAASLAAKQLAPHLAKTAGTDVSKIRSGELAEAIDGHDRAIEDLVRSRARILGIALSNMVDFLNPEMIVLGGGLTEAMPDLIRSEVEAGIQAHATPEAREGLRVAVAKLGGHAVTTGAAKWALDHTPGVKRSSGRNGRARPSTPSS